MDVWVVAAAAGAGYIAQNWKNLVRGKQNFSDTLSQSDSIVTHKCSPVRSKGQDKSHPLHEVLPREKQGEDYLTERESVPQDALKAEVASTSGFDGENLEILDGSMDCHEPSCSNFVTELLGDKDYDIHQVGVRESGIIDKMADDLYIQPTAGEIGFSYGSMRNRNSLRGRRNIAQVIKPLNSLESCLMAQLYGKHTEVEDFIFSSAHSPRTPTVRPLLVTDRGKIISRASSESFNLPVRSVESKLTKETCGLKKETAHGLPQLPSLQSFQRLKNVEPKTRLEQRRRLCKPGKIVNGKSLDSQDGPSHGALLFCLGISVGIFSSLFANKREVDKLNELLKQTENLVQDLQDELEMKDSLTVKELSIEEHDRHDTQKDGPELAFSSEQKMNEPTNCYHGEYNYQKNKCDDQKDCSIHLLSCQPKTNESTKCGVEEPDDRRKEESLSQIEAELEAELERLELRISSSTLEGKLSNLLEVDPDFIPDVAKGEFKMEYFAAKQVGDQPYADQDGSGSSSTRSANYRVSPRELTMRLHELIQSRLEERIRELETELQKSQRKVRLLELEYRNPWKKFSKSETGSSSAGGSPVAKDERVPADQPVVINLSGEALDAYNEAYEELGKINDSDLEEMPCEFKTSSHPECSPPCDENTDGIQNGQNNCTRSCIVDYGNSSITPDYGNTRNHIFIPNVIGTSGDESENSDDEMEKLLIQHIVEQTKKGSPAVLNAQRALFSLDENEHSHLTV